MDMDMDVDMDMDMDMDIHAVTGSAERMRLQVAGPESGKRGGGVAWWRCAMWRCGDVAGWRGGMVAGWRCGVVAGWR